MGVPERTLADSEASKQLNARSPFADQQCSEEEEEELDPETMRQIGARVAAGEADEATLEVAADCLLMALPFSMDTSSFTIPVLPGQRCRGVPLRLCAEHSEVAWELDGKLQA